MFFIIIFNIQFVWLKKETNKIKKKITNYL